MLDENVQEDREGEYIHEFRTNTLDLTSFGFDIGSYSILSTPKRYAVAAGPVVHITENVITLVLDRFEIEPLYLLKQAKFDSVNDVQFASFPQIISRNLCDRYRNERFILDKYESHTSSTFNMSNLGALLDNTEAAQRLRR